MSFINTLYMVAFSILSVRERLHFWNSKPSNILIYSFFFEIIFGTLLVSFDLANTEPLEWGVTFGIFSIV